MIDASTFACSLAGSMLRLCPKRKRAGRRDQHALATFILLCGGSGDFLLTTASRQADKTAASHDQTWQTCPDNRAGHCIHQAGSAIWREYVGNEDLIFIIHGEHVTKHGIRNGEDNVTR